MSTPAYRMSIPALSSAAADIVGQDDIPSNSRYARTVYRPCVGNVRSPLELLARCAVATTHTHIHADARTVAGDITSDTPIWASREWDADSLTGDEDDQ